ncbi:MAG: hypothetical protein A2X48_05590 [Lentisphaerae bacterium GWF2_49_21]|nr:MAG: hypothetical protein A2X48_05590 [Lentisphaerae bacterium GWF2_49_21]
MTDFRYSFKGKGLNERGGDNEGGTGPSFWIILGIVSLVMIGLVYLFISSNRSATAPEPVPEKEAKVEDKGRKTDVVPPVPGKEQETSPRKSSKSAGEYKMLSDDCTKAEELLKNEQIVPARDEAVKILKSGIEEDDPVWKRAVAVLNKSNTTIFFTDIPAPEKQLYLIQKGDSLIKIAMDFNTTIDAIQKGNRMNPSNPVIHPGKTLKIYKGGWKVKISKKRFKLYLYDNDNIFMIYNIGIGKQGRTPLGTFEVEVKKKEPVWYKDGKQVPYGDKENILGTRWMALKPTAGTNPNYKGYGIHGTWTPDEIGKDTSNGCIRMRNEDISDLYMIVPLKTKVLIED